MPRGKDKLLVLHSHTNGTQKIFFIENQHVTIPVLGPMILSSLQELTSASFLFSNRKGIGSKNIQSDAI
jgi:hypothetical protein